MRQELPGMYASNTGPTAEAFSGQRQVRLEFAEEKIAYIFVNILNGEWMIDQRVVWEQSPSVFGQETQLHA